MTIDSFFEDMELQLGKGTFKPHKLVMLLAVLDLMKEKPINRIYYDEELKRLFTVYFDKFSCNIDRNRPYTPFFHLRSSGFWHLVALPGREGYLETMTTVGGPGELTENVAYAFLDEKVFSCFIGQSEEIRNRIISILVKYAKKMGNSASIAPDGGSIKSVSYGGFQKAIRNMSLAESMATNDGISSENRVNEFVDYLCSLTNTSPANENALAESQLNSRFFERVRVDHPLEDYIQEQLLHGCRRVVLTGNAGDGKTTIAFSILQRLGFTGWPLQQREDLPHKRLTVIKDMSELPATARREILREIWENDDWHYLLVSNTGTLLETVRQVGELYDLTEDSLLDAMQADKPSLIGGRLLLVNAGNTCNIEPALDVLERVTDQSNWQICAACALIGNCPIYQNIFLLQDGWETVWRRLRLVYHHLYEYGSRLTMRQLVAHLAYAVTAGYDCRRLGALSEIALKEGFVGGLFFNRFFGDDGSTEDPAASQLLAVRRIRESGYGLLLDPAVEQRLWLGEDGDWTASSLAARLVKRIRGDSATEKARADRAARRQLRRLLFFWGTSLAEGGGPQKAEVDYVSSFLDSPALVEYLDLVESPQFDSFKAVRHKKKILRVLQEYFSGTLLPESTPLERLYVPVHRPGAMSTVQLLLAEFRNNDFDLERRDVYQVGRVVRRSLFLILKENPELRLELNLPFLDYVARRYRGELTADLTAFYANRLQRFKAELIRYYQNSRQPAGEDEGHLLRLAAGRLKSVRLEFAAGGLEVSL